MYRIKNSLRKFIELESFSSIILLIAALSAMVIANSSLHNWYSDLFNTKFFNLTLQHWINDGLMAIFFFVIGLELKKEMVNGELSSPRKAALPIFAAIGGMIFPAFIYLMINPNEPFKSGWGIPMATDIAFALGVLAVFGKRVPLSIKIFLLAVAIVDDLGAILVIAIFYTSKINLNALFLVFALFLFTHLLKKKQIRSYFIYSIMGFVIWSLTLKSGIHATIAGVILGLMTPYEVETKTGSMETYSPVEELISGLHPFVSYGILPLFAFANAGITLIGTEISEVIRHPVHLGILAGLVFGKPLGILIMSFVAVKIKFAILPEELRWKDIACIGIIAGIGFTMSLFISDLALSSEIEIYSKTAIVLASFISATLGFLAIYLNLKTKSSLTP